MEKLGYIYFRLKNNINNYRQPNSLRQNLILVLISKYQCFYHKYLFKVPKMVYLKANSYLKTITWNHGCNNVYMKDPRTFWITTDFSP